MPPYKGIGRPPTTCGHRSCYDKAYEKKRYQRKAQARAKADKREQSRRFAETQRMHNLVRKRVSDIIGTDDTAAGLTVSLPRDGALVTVLDPKERRSLVRDLRSLRLRCDEAAERLERDGRTRLAELLRDEAKLIDHLIETYFAAIPSK